MPAMVGDMVEVFLPRYPILYIYNNLDPMHVLLIVDVDGFQLL